MKALDVLDKTIDDKCVNVCVCFTNSSYWIYDITFL
jgi:hypothetical protein